MKIGAYELFSTPNSENIRDLIFSAIEQNPDSFGIMDHLSSADGPITTSVAKVKDDMVALGAIYHNLGLRQKHIFVAGKVSSKIMISAYAASVSGSVFIPVDIQLPLAQILDLIVHSDAEMLIYEDCFHDLIPRLAAMPTSKVKYFFNVDADYDSWVRDGEDIIRRGDFHSMQVELDPKEPSVILYTSGTTGKPKGVVLSHGAVAASVRNYCGQYDIDGSLLVFLPFNHIYGLLAPLIKMQRDFDIMICSGVEKFMPELLKYQPHVTAMVPAMAKGMMTYIQAQIKRRGLWDAYEQALAVSNKLYDSGIDKRREIMFGFRTFFGGQLTAAVVASAPISREVLQFYRGMGVDLLDTYAMTEMGSISASRRFDYRDGSQGHVPANVEVQVRNKDAHGIGDLYVRGETLFTEYYKDAALTTASFDEEGWFDTGDLGFIDEDGYLFLTGRKKNVIILSSGENVYPEELESILVKCPAIGEIIVHEQDHQIGASIFPAYAPDDTSEQHVTIQKVIKKTIADYNEKMPLYKNITKITFRDEPFPKTSSNKIKREYNNA
ncbi:MAG: acyl--CoA ligase [Clostridiales Family XIII bacterium]|jgi:long-chain acyl-CoA synthetase|nr:acyl--CoA ligase [Clostridiales Family XIII bacterium]